MQGVPGVKIMPNWLNVALGHCPRGLEGKAGLCLFVASTDMYAT